MPKMLDVQIEVPDSASEDVLQYAAARAKESAIVALQQRGELTISKAAADLGLTYEEYLQLLAQRGLPACHSEVDPDALDILRAGLRRRAGHPA